IVFVTAIKGDKESRIEALEVGAEAFLSKPIDETELTAQIRAMVKINDANRQIRNEKEHLVQMVANRTRELQQSQAKTLKILEDLKEENKARKKVEQSIKKSEERFGLAMKASQDGLYDWNLVTNEIYYSPGWKSMLGYKDHELPNELSIWEKLTLPEDVQKSWKMQQELISKERDRFELEFKMKHKKGHWIDVHSRAEAFYNKNGKAIRLVGTHVDVTDRVAKQQTIKYQASIIEQVDSAIITIGFDNKIRSWNDHAEKLYQWKKNEAIGKDIIKLLGAEELKDETLQNIVNLNRDGHWAGDYAAERKDGTSIPVHIVNTYLKDLNGTNIGYIEVSDDITERKKSDEIIKESILIFSQAEKVANLGSWKLDTETFNVTWSQGMYDLFGVDNSDNENLLEIGVDRIHPDDKKQASDLYNKATKEGIPYEMEYRIVVPDGSIKTILNSGNPTYNDRGGIISYVGVVRDITRHRLEEEERKVLITDLGERVKELNCLYNIAKVIERKDITLEGIIEETVGLLPQAWQYSEIASARIILKNSECKTDNFLESNWKQSADILIEGKKVGEVIVCYLEEKPECNEGPFLKEERNPIDTIAERLGRICHHMQAEEDLHLSEKRYRNYVDNAPDGIFVADETGRYVEVNEATCTITGYSKEDLLKMSISDILLDASIEEGLVLFAKLIKLGTAKSELMFKHKSGTTRWWIVDAVKLSETQFLCFTKDITQRKEIEEALRTKHIGLELKNNELIIAKRKAEESEALKRKLVANIGDVIVIIDYEGINRYKSPNLEKLFGWQPEELVGSSTLNNVHPDDQDSAQRFIASLVNEPGKIGTTELRYRHKNGRYSWIELTGSNMLNDPDIKGLLGNYHVITERKLSEQALLDSEKMFRTAIYNAPLPIMIHLEGGKVETLNFQWQKVTGYSLEEIPTISIWAEKAYGFNNDVIKSEIEKLYEIDGKEYEGEYIITTKSGEQRNFFFSSTSIGETSDGNNIVISMALDLTERVRVVEELKVREAKYRTILNDFPDGVIIIDVKGIITEISEIGLDLLGAENGEELIGKSFFRYPPTKEKKIIKEAIEKTLSEGIVQNIELKIRKKSKLMVLSEISLTLIQSPDAVLYSFMITIRDISQRKKMEKIQIHADRMVGLGEMASGI
ncbi:MAG: PAS domain S-box protein, partial [Candidatus Theseobacter exili]|nr:PAS domain S-box protein [Candidatus Theseobacter exili]